MNSFSKPFTRFAARTGLLLILTAIFISGCHSMDRPASAGFASVVISNQSPEKIRQAADMVFANNGYQSVQLPNGGQVYEKEASRGDQIAYAGLVGAHEGERTIVRVRMGIQPYGAHAWLLDCKAFVVTSPGDFVNEQTFPLYGFQSGPYQTLLNNIKGTVQQAAVTP
jgi:hypothetical protein